MSNLHILTPSSTITDSNLLDVVRVSFKKFGNKVRVTVVCNGSFTPELMDTTKARTFYAYLLRVGFNK